MHGFDTAWDQTVNLHEFQSKKLFAGYGIPVPFGYAVETAKEARSAAEDMGGERWVVKAQAHTGGRGKAGGVVLVDSPDQVDPWVGGLAEDHVPGASVGELVGVVLADQFRLLAGADPELPREEPG